MKIPTILVSSLLLVQITIPLFAAVPIDATTPVAPAGNIMGIHGKAKAEAYYHRGVIKSNKGQKAAAIADYDRAIALNRKYAQAYYHRGVAKAELGQQESAIEDIRTAADLFRQQGRMDLYQQAMDLIR